MRTVLFAVSLTLLAACGQPPADVKQSSLDEPRNEAARPATSAGIDGWEVDMTAYSRIGSTLPIFSVKQPAGAETTSETLRGHWTILGVWPDTNTATEEARFAAALSAAADQDPDLDVLIVHQKHEGETSAPPGQWPMLMDDGSVARLIAAPALPAYLLVGPDLTIEGYRGPLAATPDDGIKSVIRGVAEIRKQIAAPQ